MTSTVIGSTVYSSHSVGQLLSGSCTEFDVYLSLYNVLNSQYMAVFHLLQTSNLSFFV